ncbi:hypothetical protein K3495_g3251 [Podosphaera aphanis]|nr:hypothetical protein K3495_g3251 [Podosphaera aphanis]
MGGNPRALRPHVIRPSPLAQVSHQRSLSLVPPSSELIRDPLFWKRFSMAMHTEKLDVEMGKSDSESSNCGTSPSNKYDGNEWLVQQHKEKRRCRIIALYIITIIIMIVIAAAVVWCHFKARRR